MTESDRDRVGAETSINTREDMDDMRLDWARDINPAVQEAIYIAIHRLSKDGGDGASRKHVLKTLFLTKENLPNDNQVRRDLAYYWYKEGPYSTVVANNLNQMLKKGVVKYKGSKLVINEPIPECESQPATSGADMDAVRHEIGLVTSANPNENDAIQHAYETAPFKWYNTYNREFGPKLGSHFKDILAGRPSQYSVWNILEWLDDAVLDYPTDRKFMGHRAAFMDYAKMLNAFLRWDAYHTQKDVIYALQGLCDTIWVVFARGVRIHHHDSHYDDRVTDWTAQYKQDLDKLDDEVRMQLKALDGIVVDEMNVDPEVQDMVQHPEKYKFEPWVPRVAIQDG